MKRRQLPSKEVVKTSEREKEAVNLVSKYQKDTFNLERSVAQKQKPDESKRAKWDIYNATSGPLEIHNSKGTRILVLGPFEKRVIDLKLKNELEESEHFKALVEKNRTRFV